MAEITRYEVQEILEKSLTEHSRTLVSALDRLLGNQTKMVELNTKNINTSLDRLAKSLEKTTDEVALVNKEMDQLKTATDKESKQRLELLKVRRDQLSRDESRTRQNIHSEQLAIKTAKDHTEAIEDNTDGLKEGTENRKKENSLMEQGAIGWERFIGGFSFWHGLTETVTDFRTSLEMGGNLDYFQSWMMGVSQKTYLQVQKDFAGLARSYEGGEDQLAKFNDGLKQNRDQLFLMTGDLEASARVQGDMLLTSKSMAIGNVNQLVMQDKLMDSFTYLHDNLNMTADEFSNLQKTLLLDDTSRKMMLRVNKDQRAAFSQGTMDMYKYFVQVTNSEEAAKDYVSAMKEMMPKTARERIKDAAKLQAVAGSLGVEGSQEASQILMKTPGNRTGSEMKTLAKFQDKLSQAAEGMRGQGQASELMIDALDDKLGGTLTEIQSMNTSLFKDLDFNEKENIQREKGIVTASSFMLSYWDNMKAIMWSGPVAGLVGAMLGLGLRSKITSIPTRLGMRGQEAKDVLAKKTAATKLSKDEVKAHKMNTKIDSKAVSKAGKAKSVAQGGKIGGGLFSTISEKGAAMSSKLGSMYTNFINGLIKVSASPTAQTGYKKFGIMLLKKLGIGLAIGLAGVGTVLASPIVATMMAIWTGIELGSLLGRWISDSILSQDVRDKLNDAMSFVFDPIRKWYDELVAWITNSKIYKAVFGEDVKKQSNAITPTLSPEIEKIISTVAPLPASEEPQILSAAQKQGESANIATLALVAAAEKTLKVQEHIRDLQDQGNKATGVLTQSVNNAGKGRLGTNPGVFGR